MRMPRASDPIAAPRASRPTARRPRIVTAIPAFCFFPLVFIEERRARRKNGGERQEKSAVLAERGIRVNCVAPGPVWTPLIPSTMPKDKVKNFGTQVPMKRPGQPNELAPVYVMLATDEARYVSGATVAV